MESFKENNYEAFNVEREIKKGCIVKTVHPLEVLKSFYQKT